MNGTGWVLRTGEYLVGRAARYLPRSTREQRHQEWAAELPVILHDPAVRPAARRAARMLWFAADTLRGAAAARYTAAGRHAHRDADGKARDPLARDGLRALFVLLTVPGALTLWGYLISTGWSGTSLTRDVVLLLIVLLALLTSLVVRQPFSMRTHWLPASTLVVGSGQLLHDLAHRLGWGHPLLFEVIYDVSVAVLFAAAGLMTASWVRSAYARFRKART